MSATRRPIDARTVLPPPRPPVLLAAPRQPFQVLQTGRAPAQLSLFLRPALYAR